MNQVATTAQPTMRDLSEMPLDHANHVLAGFRMWEDEETVVR